MLYIVGTPIGNLGDMTVRAIETLKKVHYILCEDTRTSAVLLNHYEIKKKTVAYHKFNENSLKEKVVTDLENGLDIALISDAGMPGISDPGNILVNECRKRNLNVTVVPGPCAFVNAFILSGFKAPFTFVGFLPEKKSEKVELLTNLKSCKNVLIFYMSPHGIENQLEELYNILGARNFCIARELTKKFETVIFSTLGTKVEDVIKGELVLIVEGNNCNENEFSNLSIKQHLIQYLENGISKKDAINLVCQDRKISKKDVYKESLDL